MRPDQSNKNRRQAPLGGRVSGGGYATNMKNKCFCKMTPIECWCNEEEEDD